MRKETDSRQRRANQEIRDVMHSADLLLGRSLIVEASKSVNSGIETIQASDV